MTRPKEPVYQGKSFSQWFQEIRVLSPGQYPDPEGDPSLLAIRAMGTNAVPFVNSKLREINSPFHIKVAAWLERWPSFKYKYDDDQFFRTSLCVYTLGTNADALVPELINLGKRTDWQRCGWVIGMLGKYRDKSDQTIPFLMDMAKSSDHHLQMSAVGVLGNLGTIAKPAVPLLISQWQAETNLKYREGIAWNLRRIDKEAAETAGIK